jgi:mono/diheme cytochrome c family protein
MKGHVNRRRTLAAGVAVLVLGAGVVPLAQLDAAPSAQAATVPTAAPSIYTVRCAACHGMRLEGRTGPTLIGPIAVGRNVHELATVIRTTMPLTAPGSLTDADSLLLANYILTRNAAKMPVR